jgi:polyisoprenyl-phosphate glycosyltransferase
MERYNMYITIVTPVFNEEECIREFYDTTRKVIDSLNIKTEWLFVDDGSTDRSPDILTDLYTRDNRVKVITLSRNFGHQQALKAGIDHASGDVVITMDADLQDPPEAIAELLKKYNEGFDVVYTYRSERKNDSFFKRFTARMYYRVIKKIANVEIPLDAGDFRLMSKRVVVALKAIKEKRPYIRGLVSWLGFKQIGIPIKRESRFAGKTKYSFLKMLKFAWSGITHFSFFLIYLSIWIGFLVLIFCLIGFIYVLYVALVLKIAVPGWASIITIVLFFGGIQLVMLGILGNYIAYNYDESRNRPLYIIQSKEGFVD